PRRRVRAHARSARGDAAAHRGGDRRGGGPSLRRRGRDRGAGDRCARAARAGGTARCDRRADRRRRPDLGGRGRGPRGRPAPARAPGETAPRGPGWGAEPTAADDAARSKRAGRLTPQGDVRPLADGLLASLGERTWPVLRDRVEAVLTVSEDAIAAAMRLAWE